MSIEADEDGRTLPPPPPRLQRGPSARRSATAALHDILTSSGFVRRGGDWTYDGDEVTQFVSLDLSHWSGFPDIIAPAFVPAVYRLTMGHDAPGQYHHTWSTYGSHFRGS